MKKFTNEKGDYEDLIKDLSQQSERYQEYDEISTSEEIRKSKLEN